MGYTKQILEDLWQGMEDIRQMEEQYLRELTQSRKKKK